MKNLFKYIFLGLLIPLFACEDDDVVRFPEFQEGATMRIQVDPEFAALNAADIPNAKLRFSVFTVNDNIETVTLYGEYYSFANDSTYDQVELIQWTQEDFDEEGAIRNVEFTSQFLAEKFNLENGINDLGGGDRFDIINITELTDGRVFPDTVLKDTPYEARNVEAGILVGETSSFSDGFTAFVSCPFIQDDAVGTYQVVVDEWGDWDVGDQIEVVANAGGDGVIIKGIYSKWRSDARGPYDVEVLVDEGSGVASVARQRAWEYFWYAGQEGYGTGSVDGSGFVFSCSGVITLSLRHTVAAGSFGTYTLTLQKI